MPRPRSDPRQQSRAYELHSNGFKQKAIHEQLKKEFGITDAVSHRTVGNWIRDFKDLSTDTLLDAEFSWGKLEDYQLPWESSEYLLDMLAFIHKGGEEQYTRNIVRYWGFPSARHMTWCWRVHLAAPHLETYDVYWLSHRFMTHETMHLVTKQSRGFEGYQMYLAYKPWQSDENMSTYLQASRRGTILFVTHNDDVPWEMIRIKHHIDKLEDDSKVDALRRLMEVKPEPGETNLFRFMAMLPSQQMDYLISQSKNGGTE